MTSRELTPLPGSKERILAKPESTTNTMPGMVSDVSHTFVDTTTLRDPFALRWKTGICLFEGRPAYMGSGRMPSGPSLASRDTHRSISSLPVRNTSMSPAGRVLWMCVTASTQACR